MREEKLPANFCHQCGTKLPEGSAFCLNCGAAVTQGAAPPAPQAQQIQPELNPQSGQTDTARGRGVGSAAARPLEASQVTQGQSQLMRIGLIIIGLAAIGIGIWQVSDSGLFGGGAPASAPKNEYASSDGVSGWLVGSWTPREGNCETGSGTMEFKLGGELLGEGRSGRWQQDSVGSSLTMTSPEGQIRTMSLRPAGWNEFSLVRPDGEILTFRRCGPVGMGNPSPWP